MEWPDIDEQFSRNIVNALPYDVHAMYGLVSVFSVEYSEQVPTAMIRLIGLPRIYLNREWLNEWCHTWADIAAVIHHEITHKMLDHVREDLESLTGMTLTQDQKNFLLDIRVQGLTYQLMDNPAYQMIWRRYYGDREYPLNLLYSGATVEGYTKRQLHAAIFSPYGVSLDRVARMIFGAEGQQHQEMSEESQAGDGGKTESGASEGNDEQKDSKEDGSTWVPFVGSHEEEQEGEEMSMPSEEMREYIQESREEVERKFQEAEKAQKKQESVEAYMREQDRRGQEAESVGSAAGDGSEGEAEGEIREAPAQSWGHSESVYLQDLDIVDDRYRANRFMEDKLAEIAEETEMLRAKKAIKAMFPSRTSLLTVPNFRDRRAVALWSAGHWPVYFENTLEENKGLCHVYLDDSGSQADVIPFIVTLFHRLRRYLHDEVHFFSDNIWTTHYRNLRPGMKIESTGGTNFNAVVQHAIENNVRRCMVVTDGYSSLSQKMIDLAEKYRQQYLLAFTDSTHGGGFEPLTWREFEIPTKESHEEDTT